MSSVCQKIHQWMEDEQYRPSRRIVATSFCQVGLSWAIQQIAISVFALQGGALVVCSFTAVCLGASLLSAYSPLVRKICRCVAEFGLIRMLHDMFLTSLIHEGGHACAGTFLYRSTKRATIQFELFGGASTDIVSSKLSYLGNLVGRGKSRMIIAAAGPMASIIFGVGMFAWAAYRTNEAARERFAISGFIQIMDELSRCWSACWLKDNISLSNDYIALKELGGVSPFVLLTVMALLPAIQIAWMGYLYLRGPKSLPIT